MTYKEFRPLAGLSNVIECVWTRLPDAKSHAEIETHQAQSAAHTILPDGAMDVIATFFPDGELDDAFVVGSMTQPQVASLGAHPLIGVRFLPGVGGSALGVNAATLTDEQADVHDVFRNTTLIRDAFRALRLDSSSAHALHLFAQGIGMEKREVPSLVRQAAKQLGQSRSALRVEQVARELRITRQHLTRVFSAHSGLTPKLFAQICRVRALLTTAQSQLLQSAAQETSEGRRTRLRTKRTGHNTSDTWSTLAAEFRYADQSHLIAEVQSVIGQTPSAWQATAGSNIPIVPVPVGPL